MPSDLSEMILNLESRVKRVEDYLFPPGGPTDILETLKENSEVINEMLSNFQNMEVDIKYLKKKSDETIRILAKLQEQDELLKNAISQIQSMRVFSPRVGGQR